jgi:hypothetical protein
VLNERGDGKSLPLSSAQVSLESPAHVETPLLSLPNQKSSLRDSRRPNVTLSSWVFFSFKPYVFPKDHLDREVIAPVWFKYLGRALLGLMIAILLTKQLNIWKQIMACYWMLLGATRAEKHRGVTNTLTRQQEEMVDHLSSIFNHYSFTWRWLLMYAVTAPTMSLRWRLILDPASAYYMGMERVPDRPHYSPLLLSASRKLLSFYHRFCACRDERSVYLHLTIFRGIEAAKLLSMVDLVVINFSSDPLLFELLFSHQRRY